MRLHTAPVRRSFVATHSCFPCIRLVPLEINLKGNAEEWVEFSKSMQSEKDAERPWRGNRPSEQCHGFAILWQSQEKDEKRPGQHTAAWLVCHSYDSDGAFADASAIPLKVRGPIADPYRNTLRQWIVTPGCVRNERHVYNRPLRVFTATFFSFLVSTTATTAQQVC